MTDDQDYEIYIIEELARAATRCHTALIRFTNPDLPAVIPDDYLMLLLSAEDLEPHLLLNTIIALGAHEIDLPYPYGVKIHYYANDFFKSRRAYFNPAQALLFFADHRALVTPDATADLYRDLEVLHNGTHLAASPHGQDILFSLAILTDAQGDHARLADLISHGNINKFNVVPLAVHSLNVATTYFNTLAQANRVPESVTS